MACDGCGEFGLVRHLEKLRVGIGLAQRADGQFAISRALIHEKKPHSAHLRQAI